MGLVLLLAWFAPAEAVAGVALVRRVELDAVAGVPPPSGIAFRPEPPAFLVVGPAKPPRIWSLDLGVNGARPRLLGVSELDGNGVTPAGVAWGATRGSTWIVDDEALRALELDAAGRILTRLDLGGTGARDPEGIVTDAAGQRLWISDGRARRVLELTPAGRLVASLALDADLLDDAEGIAYDPASDHLFVVSDREARLAELTRSGQLVGVYALAPLGAIRPQGITVGPGDAPGTTHLYVADALHENGAGGRLLELALVRRPEGARTLISQVGDADGFGFRGIEPGFAAGDLDHDGLLEPGERIPPREAWDNRGPEDPRTTDRTWVVDERQPLAFDHALELDGPPLWARLTLVVADARAVPGRRCLVRADGRLLGEVVPTADGRIRSGQIAAVVLELPPASLRDLADGALRVELAREPGSGSDDVMVDFSRLEVAVAP